VALRASRRELEAHPELLALKEIEMSKFVSRFMKDESGATAIEYGLIAALVSVVIVSALTALGPKLKGTFESITAALP
jgi:pilus assembly protein Flp/PilA